MTTDPEFYLFSYGDAMNREAQGVKGDSAVGIDRSLEPETKDIIEGLIGFGNNKGPEECSFLLKRALESRMRDLLSGGVNPLEAVLIEFPAQHLPRLLDRGDPVPHTRSDQVVLNPAVWSLDLTLGCRTQRIANLDAQIRQHFLPLHDGIFFLRMRLLPDGISFLDKSEDRVVIDVVLQGTAHACDQSLGGHNVRP